MRKYLMAAMAGIFLMAAPAHADDRVVRELPGNVTIVTDPNRDARGVRIYTNDDSILYRTLVAPHNRTRDLQTPNSASLDDVDSICGNSRNMTAKNRCIRDVIKEREALQRRYN